MSYFIKNQVFFNGSWQELNNFTYGKAFYPVEVSEKLSEELDSGELKFYTDSRENNGKEMLYPQKTMFSIEIDTGTDRARKFYFYGTDTAEKLNPYLWKHRVLLAEPTKDLEGVILDGLGFAQPEDNSQRMTLYDIVQRLLKCTPLRKQRQVQKYTLVSEADAPEIIAILKAQTVEEKLLPEFFWSSQTTLKEALCDIGAYCNLYPRLTLNPATNEYTVITFDEVNKVREFLDGMGYVAEMVSQNEEQYVSELETNAQNVISKSQDTSTIVYPSPTGWVTPRTEEVRLTSDNAEIELPFNINKITRIFLCAEGKHYLYFDSEHWTEDGVTEHFPYLTDAVSFEDIYEEKSGKKWDCALDITKFVKEKSEFDTLDMVKAENLSNTINKCNVFYYEKGSNKINFGNTVSDYWGVSTPNIYNVIDKFIEDFNFEANKDNNPYFMKLYCITREGTKLYVSDNTTITGAKSSYPIDPRGIKFRIEYEPLDTSSKFRVSKSLPMDKPFIQNYNQRAEINSAEALGRNMKGTVNKMGVPTKNHLLIEQDLSKVPHVGDAYEKDGRTYIVSQIDYDCFSLYGMGVNLTLSQDWNMLSQYVGIDRRFRWEQIYNKPVERNLFYPDYLVILPYGSANRGENIYLADITKATDVLQCAYEEKTEVNNCFLTCVAGRPLRTQTGVVLSASSYATGGAMLFTAKTQDNLSAGKTMQDSQYCIDAFYCNENGTAGEITVRLATDINADYLQPDKLPLFSYLPPEGGDPSGYNFYTGVVAEDTFQVYKNNSEQLNFVYELTWVSPCPYLVIGEKLAANNPLVRQWNENRKFRFVFLSRRLPQGTVKVTNSYIYSEYPIADDAGRENYYSLLTERDSDGRASCRLQIKEAIASSWANVEQIVGWAVTDETHGLLLACNDKTKTDFKIITSHEYHGKPWKI